LSATNLRVLELSLYCYGINDHKCKVMQIALQKLRNRLIIDYMVDLKINLVDIPMGANYSIVPKFPSSEDEKRPRLKIENTYVLMDDECTEEIIKGYLLRALTFKLGIETVTKVDVIEMYKGMSEVGESEALEPF